jgi:acetyltransferase-like isoleucine patch superfamily enzyme
MLASMCQKHNALDEPRRVCHVLSPRADSTASGQQQRHQNFSSAVPNRPAHREYGTEMPVIDAKSRAKLLKNEVGCLHQNAFSLPDDCEFEPPCSLKWMQVSHSLALGAFSYAVSGHYFAVRIGRYVSIGEDVQIGRHNHPPEWASTSPFFFMPHANALDFQLDGARNVLPKEFTLGKAQRVAKITRIGNDVWIGHGAFVSPGVTIGDGAVIGAQSVVTKDVPPYAIVAGAPATVRRMRFDDKTVGRMLALRWWRFAFWDLAGASLTEPDKFLDTIEHKITTGAITDYAPKKRKIAEILTG